MKHVKLFLKERIKFIKQQIKCMECNWVESKEHALEYMHLTGMLCATQTFLSDYKVFTKSKKLKE